MQIRRLVAAAAVPLLLVSVGCSKKDKNKEAAAKSCDGLLKAADPAAALPGTVPAGVTGATFYEVDTAGKTKSYFAYLAGSDVVATRDTVKAAFQQAGLTIKGTDQEVGAEAELEFQGSGLEGTVQVIPLCKDTLRVRWRFGPK